MSVSVNSVFLGGNLTRDPELRYTPNGAAVCNFDLAVNRRYAASDGSQKEETLFIRISSFGRQAETCHQYLSKGSPVLVEGWLHQGTWETESGEKRSRIEARARRVQFLGPPGGGGGGGGGRSQGPSDEAEESELPEDDVPF